MLAITETHKNNENKDSRMGHTKNIFKKKNKQTSNVCNARGAGPIKYRPYSPPVGVIPKSDKKCIIKSALFPGSVRLV
jgi:hypothetical protein